MWEALGPGLLGLCLKMALHATVVTHSIRINCPPTIKDV